MAARHFMELLRARWAEGKFVCVGLDSEAEKIPPKASRFLQFGNHIDVVLKLFNGSIIDATNDLVCAFKPNFAFYLRHGAAGLDALAWTIREIRTRAPEVPVILDAKLADIGNTNEQYARYVYDELGADALTVHPYLGREALKPFLDREDKGIFVLCRTSNLGAHEFQDLGQIDDLGQLRGQLYEVVARNVSTKWNVNGNCGLVVGATYPHELQSVRRISGDLPLLIPGIGAQGGDLEASVKAGMDSRGQGFIINSSSGIIFASSGDDFAEAARAETQKLHDAITRIREEILAS